MNVFVNYSSLLQVFAIRFAAASRPDLVYLSAGVFPLVQGCLSAQTSLLFRVCLSDGVFRMTFVVCPVVVICPVICFVYYSYSFVPLGIIKPFGFGYPSLCIHSPVARENRSLIWFNFLFRTDLFLQGLSAPGPRLMSPTGGISQFFSVPTSRLSALPIQQGLRPYSVSTWGNAGSSDQEKERL